MRSLDFGAARLAELEYPPFRLTASFAINEIDRKTAGAFLHITAMMAGFFACVVDSGLRNRCGNSSAKIVLVF